MEVAAESTALGIISPACGWGVSDALAGTVCNCASEATRRGGTQQHATSGPQRRVDHYAGLQCKRACEPSDGSSAGGKPNSQFLTEPASWGASRYELANSLPPLAREASTLIDEACHRSLRAWITGLCAGTKPSEECCPALTAPNLSGLSHAFPPC